MTEAENIFLDAYDVLVRLLNRNNRMAAQNLALEVGAVANRYAAANKLPDAGTPASRSAGPPPSRSASTTGE